VGHEEVEEEFHESWWGGLKLEEQGP